MRKIIVLAGLLGAAALFTGSPAQAWVGCECVKLGAPSVCVPGVLECGARGGICLAPCDYKAPMTKGYHHKHHMHHKPMHHKPMHHKKPMHYKKKKM